MWNLRAALTPHVESGEIPGLVALIARGDEIAVETLGVQSTPGVPMARDSIVRAASITKPLTAALTMMLVEDGRLELDAPVAGLLPELTAPRVLRAPASEPDDTVACARPVTVRDLLTFTAGHGFPSDFALPIVGLLAERLHQGPPNPAAVPPPDEWMRRLSEIPLLHQPGEGWTYNTGSDILGVLLARASGTSLADLMTERLLEPLGMADTNFHVPAEKLDRFTTLYVRGDNGELSVKDEPDGQWSAPPDFASAAGGLVTTVDDWLAFGRMLLSEGLAPTRRLLGADSVRQMMTDHTTVQQREAGVAFLDGQGWGFGGTVDIERHNPWNHPGRYGWVGGTGTAAYVDPSHNTVSIILTQVELGAPDSAAVLESFWTAAAP